MKIIREINGERHEIELTKAELYQAYRAQEHEYDMEDIRSELECRDEDDFQDDYGITKKAAMSLVSDIAYGMRSKLDDEHSIDYKDVSGKAHEFIRGMKANLPLIFSYNFAYTLI